MPLPRNTTHPIHPGEILREDFLLRLEISANVLAKEIGVPANRISAIVAGERGVTADTALRLAKALGTTPEFWLSLQQTYELRLAEQDRDLAAALRGIRRLHG
jgi:addiction module HigA family antidote